MTVNGSALGLAFVIAVASACSSSSTPAPADSGSDASSVATDASGDTSADARNVATDAARDTSADAADASNVATDAAGDTSTDANNVAIDAAGDSSADASGAPIDAATDRGVVDASVDAAGGIVVTSPGFAEGQTIPAVYTCAGADTSPEIDWTAGPSTTQSYAVVVSDLTATQNIHWVVWDLPPTTRSLPATLPGDPTLTSPVTGFQVDLRTNPEAGTTMNGYFGPCPRGNLHSYEYAVHAIDVATLPGVTTTSRSADVKTVVLAHSLAQGTLDGTSNANLPTDAGGQ
jgi:Raf kinase inhibitor-like YbhB/YbcL family protein